MNSTPNISNIFFSCGMSEDEYKSVRKKAYAANVNTWKYLSILIAVFFIGMIILTLATPNVPAKIAIYIFGASVSIVSIVLFFFVINPTSFFSQLLIYLDIVAILAMGISLSLASSSMMAVTFIAILLVMPTFVVNRPCYNALLVIVSGAANIYCTINYKDIVARQGDIANTIIFGILSIVISCIYSSLRFRDFALQKQIEKDRDTDGLTGLCNKDALMRGINAFLSESDKHGVMLAMDIDDFKCVNDNYGHVAGDVVLSVFGKTLQGFTSENDICGRFGGDEFIVLFKDKELKEAEDITNDIINAISKAVRTPNKNDIVTFSAGLAECTGEEVDYDDLFRKADTALYAAKAAGKNCCKIYQ